MAGSEADRIHKKSVIVEGHRDIFEKFHLEKQGQQYPVLNVTLPRLKRANISTTFYSVCGDSLTHVRGTYRYLSSALENIDALREEIAASKGQMKLILFRDDLPSAPTPETVHFVLSFEGGRPLEGRIENLRNF
jgi:microsomal dipeptidase-like Zn-dependent dipeptidase